MPARARSLLVSSTASYTERGRITPPNSSPRRTRLTTWHINADEPRVLDYNEEYKSAGQVTSLYIEDAYRSSDHDPVIVGLELGEELPYRAYLPLVISQEPALRPRSPASCVPR